MPAGLKAPLHESDYKDGGTQIYLLRLAGHEIFIMGSMNCIEADVTSFRPDIAIIGAGKDRAALIFASGSPCHPPPRSPMRFSPRTAGK